jgi:hypothetical protein
MGSGESAVNREYLGFGQRKLIWRGRSPDRWSWVSSLNIE